MKSKIATKKKKPIISRVMTTIIGISVLSLLTGCISREPTQEEIADAVMSSLETNDNSSLQSVLQDWAVNKTIDRESIKKNSCEKNSGSNSYMCDTSMKIAGIARTVSVRMEKVENVWEADVHLFD